MANSRGEAGEISSLKDIRANCFCAYCARKFTRHVMHRARAKALPGFNDLGRSATPLVLSMDHYSTDFLRLAKK